MEDVLRPYVVVHIHLFIMYLVRCEQQSGARSLSEVCHCFELEMEALCMECYGFLWTKGHGSFAVAYQHVQFTAQTSILNWFGRFVLELALFCSVMSVLM